MIRQVFRDATPEIRLRCMRGMHVIFLIGVIELFATVPFVNAQTFSPPPGFSPGQGDDAAPDTPAPTQRIFDGHSDYSTPSNDPIFGGPSNSVTGPLRYPSPQRRNNTFRTPPDAVLLGNDEPPMPRFWFRSEALLWWSKSSPISVPLVTLGNPADPIPGAIGQPGTSVLLGNQNLGLPTQGGGRFTLGFTFDADQAWGAEGSYFFLGNASTTRGVFSDGTSGSALLAFPFYDPTLPGENASPIANPGNFSGNAAVTVQSLLQGVDLNLIHNQLNANGFRLDVLGGFRYVNLHEDLNFQTQSPNLGSPSSFFNTFDEFNTNNNFYGGQVGLRASYDPNRLLFMNATTKLAVGDMFENVSINGGTFTNIGGGFGSANGAYLTGPSNIGSQTRSQFTVIPEMNLNLGIRLRPWASFIVGYSFLYISSVARPGQQIDHSINPNNAPAINGNFSGNVFNPAHPVPSVTTTDFWAQGLNFTLELRF